MTINALLEHRMQRQAASVRHAEYSKRAGVHPSVASSVLCRHIVRALCCHAPDAAHATCAIFQAGEIVLLAECAQVRAQRVAARFVPDVAWMEMVGSAILDRFMNCNLVHFSTSLILVLCLPPYSYRFGGNINCLKNRHNLDQNNTNKWEIFINAVGTMRDK